MPKFKKPLAWFIRAILIIALVSIYPFLLRIGAALYSSIGQFDSNPQAIILYIDIRYPRFCPFRHFMRVWGDGLAFLEEDNPSSGRLDSATLHTLLDILRSEHFFIGWQADGPNPAGTALKIGTQLKGKPVVEYTSGNLGPTLYMRIKDTIQPALKPLTEQRIVDERVMAILKENENCNQYMYTPPLELLPPPPTEVPPGYQAPGYRTPTPDMLHVTIVPFPTPTLFVISITTDLSPNLEDGQKFHIYVRHSNGMIELFLIGPLPTGETLESNQLPPDILSKLPLQPGDQIFTWMPPWPYRMGPPTELSPEMLATILPHPYQATETATRPYP